MPINPFKQAFAVEVNPFARVFNNDPPPVEKNPFAKGFKNTIREQKALNKIKNFDNIRREKKVRERAQAQMTKPLSEQDIKNYWKTHRESLEREKRFKELNTPLSEQIPAKMAQLIPQSAEGILQRVSPFAKGFGDSLTFNQINTPSLHQKDISILGKDFTGEQFKNFGQGAGNVAGEIGKFLLARGAVAPLNLGAKTTRLGPLGSEIAIDTGIETTIGALNALGKGKDAGGIAKEAAFTGVAGGVAGPLVMRGVAIASRKLLPPIKKALGKTEKFIDDAARKVDDIVFKAQDKVARKTTQETLVKHGIADDQAASITGTAYDAPVIADDFLPPALRAIKEADAVPTVAGSSRTAPSNPVSDSIPDNSIDPIDQSAKFFAGIFDGDRLAKESLLRERTKVLMQRLKTKLFDVSGNIKQELRGLGPIGEDAATRHTLILGTSGRAEKRLSDAFSTVYKGLNGKGEQQLNALIRARSQAALLKRRPDVARSFSADDADNFSLSFQKNNPELFNELNQRADNYFNVMRTQLDELYEEGIITQELHEILRPIDYERTQFIDFIDPDGGTVLRPDGSRVNVGDSGIDKLKEGSLGAFETDSRLLMQDMINRTQSRITKNRANKTLIDLADSVPDNGIVQRINDATKTPPGHQVVSAFIKGKKTDMIMPSKFANEWVQFDPQIKGDLGGWVSTFSGAKSLRFFATGANPEFALTNVIRDAQLQFIATSERSSFLPIFAVQLSSDIKAVVKDSILRRGLFDDFVENGGMMSFLTRQGGTGGRTATGLLGKMGEYLGYLGETSEITMRLALYRRALINGRTKEQAARISREYIDFNQGGSFVKALDKGLPYFNATFQATRSVFNASTRNTPEFIWKAAQMATLASGLYQANKHINPEAWDSISDHEKRTGFIVTTPFKKMDEDGNTRHFYYKIPLDQQQGVLVTLVRAAHERMDSGTIPSDSIIESFKDFLPATADKFVPPVLQGMLALSANKDFWRNQDIWQGADVGAANEINDRTSEFAQDVAGAANKVLPRSIQISPARFDTAKDKLFTSTNLWTSLVGHGYDKVFGGNDEVSRQDIDVQFVKNTPFLRRLMRVTPKLPENKYRTIKAAKQEVNADRYRANRELDDQNDLVDTGERSNSDVVNWIKSQPVVDRKRLKNRFIAHKKLKGIPEKNLLMSIQGIPSPEKRAEVLAKELNSLDPIKSKRLLGGAMKVPGLFGKTTNSRFNEEFRRQIQEQRRQQ